VHGDLEVGVGGVRVAAGVVDDVVDRGGRVCYFSATAVLAAPGGTCGVDSVV
jgi:hypothetical protein